jgi:hypothetical protein
MARVVHVSVPETPGTDVPVGVGVGLGEVAVGLGVGEVAVGLGEVAVGVGLGLPVPAATVIVFAMGVVTGEL